MNTDENKDLSKNEEKSKNPSRGEGFAAIIFGVIFYFLVNRYYDNINFINEDLFEPLLYWINLSIYVSIGFGILRVFFPGLLMKILNDFVGLIFSIILGVKTLSDYPFDFSDYKYENIYEPGMKVLIVLGIVGGVIGLIVSIAKYAKLKMKD